MQVLRKDPQDDTNQQNATVDLSPNSTGGNTCEMLQRNKDAHCEEIGRTDANTEKYKFEQTQGSGKKSEEYFKTKRKLKKCAYCNQIHIWGKNLCSSFGRRCSYCGVLNHCEEACFWKHPELLEPSNRNIAARNFKRNSVEQPKEANDADKTPAITTNSVTSKEGCEYNDDLTEEKKKEKMEIKCLDERPIESSDLSNMSQKEETAPTENAEQFESEDFITEPSQELSNVSAKEDGKLPYWDEDSWALEQIKHSEDVQWFELDHVKDYYESLGGVYLTKFIEKFQNLKMIGDEKLYTISSSTITADISEEGSRVVGAKTEVLEKPETSKEEMTLKWVNCKLKSNYSSLVDIKEDKEYRSLMESTLGWEKTFPYCENLDPWTEVIWMVQNESHSLNVKRLISRDLAEKAKLLNWLKELEEKQV